MELSKYENKVNSNKNRNTRFVKIRLSRICNSCGKVQNVGTKCLTTNKKGAGRQWYCMKCVNKILIHKSKNSTNINRNCHLYKCILSTLQDYNNLTYDDEGGAMATLDALSELEDKCLDCGNCDFADMIYNNYY